MNVFFLVERWCSTWVERLFASIFPSRLEPVHIARRLISSLEATRPPPTDYRVYLHPRDQAELEADLPDLIRSWEMMLTEMARRLSLALAATPTVTICHGPQLAAGSVRVDAEPGASIMRLRVIRGIPANAVITVQDVCILGRAPESDLPLFDPNVSRRHASLCRQGEVLELRDLGSLNGCYFENRRVEHATLHRGDRITIGSCELQVE